jgi:MFS family permease
MPHHLVLDHLTVLDRVAVLAGPPIPTIPKVTPPGSEKILDIVGFVQWVAGAGIIACFLGGIVAFTAGRMFDHHRTGRMGLIFIMAAGVGALLFAVGPELLNTLSAPGK